jgi:hypothetical protein
LSTLAVSLPVKVFTFITSPSYESLVILPRLRSSGGRSRDQKNPSLLGSRDYSR